jgi:hypothetical protein
MEIYAKHPIRFAVSRIGNKSMASGTPSDSYAGWAYGFVLCP